MFNSSIRKVFLPLNLGFDDPIAKQLSDFLLLLKKSGVFKVLKQLKTTGRRPYNGENLFATCLYGFAFNSPTLRELETSCKYDLRYKYLMENDEPTYQTFSAFLNDTIKPNIDEIFHLITAEIAKEMGSKIHEYAFVDGTKFEADCNKYKFVWKPITFHKKLTVKVINILQEYHLENDIDQNELISSATLAYKITQLSEMKMTEVEDKKRSKNIKLLMEKLNKVLEYEEKERICGPNRNSYYKTDYDATAMCLKDDYYAGLGSSMHAAYSTQIIVSNYLITSFLVSQERVDINDFINVLEVYRKNYKCFPKKICADAGYGSEKNYEYLNTHNIKSFVKFQTWQGNISGKNPDRFSLTESGFIKCLYGRIGHETKINYRPRYKNSSFFKVHNCSFCSVNNYCKLYMSEENKKRTFKVFEVRKKFTLLKQQAEQNLLSIEGIEMRVNRSMQVEGAYGVVKQDIFYNRLRRTGFESAKMEIGLTFLAYNIRKYFAFLGGARIKKFRDAPPNCEAEIFKKPRFNILQKRHFKTKKEPNEKSKSSYKRKH